MFLLILAQNSFAQELQFQISKNSCKIALENTQFYKNNMFYAYSELSVSNSTYAYIQTFYEYSFGFLSPHIEYRSMYSLGSDWINTLIAGVSIPILNKEDYLLSVSALYRLEVVSMWQVSAVYSFNYKNISFSGYFDLYGDRSINAFSENKLKIYMGDIFLGANAEYSLYSNNSIITPYVMIGYKF